MNHSRTGKVDVAVSKIHGRSNLRQPAAAPNPAAEDRIQNRAHEEFAKEEPPEGDPFTNGANDDVSGRLHEHHLKERQAQTAGIVTWAGEKKAPATQEPPLAAAEEEVVERGDAAEICGGRINCDRPELKGVPHGVVGEEGEDVGREVQHHQMGGIFLTHQSASEQGKSSLHE